MELAASRWAEAERLEDDYFRLLNKYEPQHIEDESGIYLFVSFDLVNSTKFKTKVADWYESALGFYADVIKEFGSHIRESAAETAPIVWKQAGDEVLFYLRVERTSTVCNALEAAWQTMETVAADLERRTVGKVQLSVKASAWVAQVQHFLPIDGKLGLQSKAKPHHFDSIRFEVGRTADFIGQDIDIGFRASKFTDRHILLISAELAYVLCDGHRNHRVIVNHLRVVGFECMKGVWGDRHYPIVWYHGNWGRYLPDYDARLKNPKIGVSLDTRKRATNLIHDVFADGDDVFIKRKDHLETMKVILAHGDHEFAVLGTAAVDPAATKK